MILKKRTMPIRLKQLEALLRRLPKNHPKQKIISEDFAKQMAGYKGEQAVDYQLSLLPEQHYVMIHDLRLFDGSHYFQLDTLIITKKFILFLEVKNITGTLVFDTEFNQLIRISDNKSEGLPNPTHQIYRQQFQLQKALHTNIPIESLIVISHPRTILKSSSPNHPLSKTIIHNTDLIQTINKIDTSYKNEILTHTQLRKLTDKIIKSHQPLTFDVFSYYQLQKSDLLTGVQCPTCSHTPILRINRKWQCPMCHSISNDAHIRAIQDYALLINTQVSNRDIRAFLHITSIDITKHLLLKLNFPYTGSCSARKYYLTFQET